MFLLSFNLFEVKGQHLSGIPLIENYTIHDYKSVPQNWDLVQDQRGKLLVANNLGLLTYDGNKWELHDESFNNQLFTVARIGDSIYVGGENNFGLVKSDSAGRFRFESLIHLIPDSISEFGSGKF